MKSANNKDKTKNPNTEEMKKKMPKGHVSITLLFLNKLISIQDSNETPFRLNIYRGIQHRVSHAKI